MEEGSPIFSHLFSSPLTHEATGVAGATMTGVDELDYQAEYRSLKQLLEKSNWVDVRWKSSHCSITNFLDSFTNCKILHFTGAVCPTCASLPSLMLALFSTNMNVH